VRLLLYFLYTIVEGEIMMQQPKLTRLANRKYQSDDIPKLHSWLEDNGYRFYGAHAADEYGRFSHQEKHVQAGQSSFSNGYIQVLATGEIYTPDPHSWQLLDSLVKENVPE
jgi:hypothetical protein